ncbi:MAG TPA: hypothetical protein VE130_13900 [Nitrososphaeraceae archaeon]|jgi:hypothetical protein|nr:hypothetical protein [Nitrososphaeraceae archaeon]
MVVSSAIGGMVQIDQLGERPKSSGNSSGAASSKKAHNPSMSGISCWPIDSTSAVFCSSVRNVVKHSMHVYDSGGGDMNSLVTVQERSCPASICPLQSAEYTGSKVIIGGGIIGAVSST